MTQRTILEETVIALRFIHTRSSSTLEKFKCIMTIKINSGSREQTIEKLYIFNKNQFEIYLVQYRKNPIYIEEEPLANQYSFIHYQYTKNIQRT